MTFATVLLMRQFTDMVLKVKKLFWIFFQIHNFFNILQVKQYNFCKINVFHNYDFLFDYYD